MRGQSFWWSHQLELVGAAATLLRGALLCRMLLVGVFLVGLERTRGALLCSVLLVGVFLGGEGMFRHPHPAPEQLEQEEVLVRGGKEDR